MKRHPALQSMDSLFREAELQAERIVAILRMAVAATLAVLFILAVWRQGLEPSGTLLRQWAFAGATFTAYFLLGFLTLQAIRKRHFRLWMIWPAAMGDALFLLTSLWLSLANTGLPGGAVLMFPSAWLAPLVLAFGALRFNPYLQGFLILAVVSGLAILMGLHRGADGDTVANQWGLLLGGSANVMRLTMLALAGVVLVVAALRMRALTLKSIAEARRSMNLTRYLPVRLAPRLAEGGLDELRRGRMQRAGILFADMRGFTSWSQDRSPGDVSEFISQFRARITRVTDETGGIIDKFIGDAAMIVFEAGDDPQSAAKASVDCAEKLIAEMVRWSADRARSGAPEVRIGVGLHWGEVFSGVVGDSDRLEYSVFGDAVNTAARLEESAKELNMDIVASCLILRLAFGGKVPRPWQTLPPAHVRGRTGSLDIAGQ